MGVVVVCNCLAVNERAVRASIERGAATVDEVTEACDAGGGCGRCWPRIQALLAASSCADRAVRAA